MPDDTGGRTDVLPEVVFLGKLVEQVAAGRIRVPRFQRAFVWRQADLHDLLDSVIRGFPIGSILVWETENAIASAPRVGPIEIDHRPSGQVGYLLDGQQRVSTLVGTLRLPDDAESIEDGVNWRLYCDLDSREFLPIPSERVEPKHFPVRSLLDTAGFIAACRRIADEVDDGDVARQWLNEADRLANAFRDYQLPLIRIREASLDSAVAVFARLNRKGRKMAADEMVSALTYRQGEFHLAAKLDEFKEELAWKGFGNLDRVLLLRSVLAALGRDIYAKDWADLMVKPEVRERLPEAFESAESGINRALEFLKLLGVTSDRLLPYGLQLVFLGEFFRLCREPGANVLDLLRRWFWVTSFTGWFGGVNSAQATHALSEVRMLADGTGTGFSVVDLDAAARPFPQRFDGRSARVRAFLLYLASLRPRSMHAPGVLDSGKLLSDHGIRAVGYVSSSAEIPRELFSSPANRVFFDSGQVGQAFLRMGELDDETLAELLPTHGFPADSLRWIRSGERAGLIESRLDCLIAGEREFMKGLGVSLPVARTAANIADSEVSDEE